MKVGELRHRLYGIVEMRSQSTRTQQLIRHTRYVDANDGK